MSTRKSTPPLNSKSSIENKSFGRKSSENKSFESKPREQKPRELKATDVKSKTTVEAQAKKPSNKALSASQKKQFRTIGHQLNPVVILGDGGLSENVKKELNRALEDHELIKIKIPSGERTEKQKLIDALCKSCQCALVQQVGNMVLIYRAGKNPNPKLSNILKSQSL